MRRSTIDDEYVGTIGDGDGSEDPPFVKIRRTAFKWKNVSPLEDHSDISDVLRFFADKNNYGTLFDSGSSQKRTPQPVPTLALVPAEIALRVVEYPTTLWELWELLDSFAEDRSPEVQELLVPTCLWAVMTCLKGQNADTSAMLYALP